MKLYFDTIRSEDGIVASLIESSHNYVLEMMEPLTENFLQTAWTKIKEFFQYIWGMIKKAFTKVKELFTGKKKDVVEKQQEAVATEKAVDEATKKLGSKGVTAGDVAGNNKTENESKEEPKAPGISTSGLQETIKSMGLPVNLQSTVLNRVRSLASNYVENGGDPKKKLSYKEMYDFVVNKRITNNKHLEKYLGGGKYKLTPEVSKVFINTPDVKSVFDFSPLKKMIDDGISSMVMISSGKDAYNVVKIADKYNETIEKTIGGTDNKAVSNYIDSVRPKSGSYGIFDMSTSTQLPDIIDKFKSSLEAESAWIAKINIDSLGSKMSTNNIGQLGVKVFNKMTSTVRTLVTIFTTAINVLIGYACQSLGLVNIITSIINGLAYDKDNDSKAA